MTTTEHGEAGRVSYLNTGVGTLAGAKKYLRDKFRQAPLEPIQQRPDRLFYVTIRDGARVGFLLGPYVSHMTALAAVARGRRLARVANPAACEFAAFGTSSLPRERRPRTVFGR